MANMLAESALICTNYVALYLWRNEKKCTPASTKPAHAFSVAAHANDSNATVVPFHSYFNDSYYVLSYGRVIL